jgi:L-histidine N-alpha-methyltransferase
MSVNRSPFASTARSLPTSAEALAMAAEIRQTLTDTPPWIPSKYLYDDRGSRLFDEITRLPEYYPTRTEEGLLETVAGEVMDAVDPVEIVELGSGVGRKIRLLVEQMLARHERPRAVLVDINPSVVAESVAELRRAYPRLDVVGSVADFERESPRVPRAGRRLMVFFAGTIGNLHPDDVPAFLRRQGAALAAGDFFLVGVDLVKDRARLEAAYNDARGVTACFNLNVLRVLNERLGADFDPDAFEHVAFFDEAKSWIEMRVRARRGMQVTIPAVPLEMALEPGDEIRTEISCKYTRESFAARMAGTGFSLDRWRTDPDRLFALALLVRTDDAEPGPWKSRPPF